MLALSVVTVPLPVHVPPPALFNVRPVSLLRASPADRQAAVCVELARPSQAAAAEAEHSSHRHVSRPPKGAAAERQIAVDDRGLTEAQ